MYAWWGSPQQHRLWRIYGGDLTLHYRFGNRAKSNPFAGHYLGLYAGIFTFDFQLGGNGYMGGNPGGNLWTRFMLNAGVEYGYSLPISRRLNLDFTLGIGYIGGYMEKYKAKDNLNIWDAKVRKTWVGPSKVEVSLVWLIGSGNYNPRKEVKP